ncbi:unnamed protein product [Trifolium pratense]|uniref:Uncharacterized protein n=1 Tax=Trifolium pratense TaxID=57577 RepID=A0ACB0KPZ6_TRIPR|nr:unnamed protein product [Trifolium pratense]
MFLSFIPPDSLLRTVSILAQRCGTNLIQDHKVAVDSINSFKLICMCLLKLYEDSIDVLQGIFGVYWVDEKGKRSVA